MGDNGGKTGFGEGDLLDDVWIDLMRHRFGTDAQCVFYRARAAGAVGDDDDAIDTEQRTAAIFVGVDAFF